MVKRYDVITLFPEMFDAIADCGVTRRALDAGVWELHCWNPRDFADDAYRSIDDRPFGGGPGMVMKPEPLSKAIDAARARQHGAGAAASRVVCLSPQARPIDDAGVRRLAGEEGVVFLCGRYEGIDERVIAACVDQEVSIGDYVLSGGELAAMVLIDAMLRLQPGVLNDGQSADQDSFSPARRGWLDHPHYTRPESWNGAAVPPVLLSGNHAAIAEWRSREALKRTWLRRPDLIETSRLTKQESAWLAEFAASTQASASLATSRRTSAGLAEGPQRCAKQADRT